MTDLPYQIAAALRKSRSVFIACHVAPDGDCLGSALALQLALARIGRPAQVGSADGVPEPFRELPGAGRVLTAPPAPPADVAVAAEGNTVDRAGAFAPTPPPRQTPFNIQHPRRNAGYCYHVLSGT